jgi:hypothetical protein
LIKLKELPRGRKALKTQKLKFLHISIEALRIEKSANE